MNTRDRLAEALPEHQAWCHGEALTVGLAAVESRTLLERVNR